MINLTNFCGGYKNISDFIDIITGVFHYLFSYLPGLCNINVNKPNE